MDTFINLCGFLGAWLLVAGPVYQAALELKDEDLEESHLKEVGSKLPPQEHSSTWWWLLPPVKLFLERRLNSQYRKRFFQALSPEDAEAMLSFVSKATGWLYVSGGGLLIAVKETHELVVHFAWSTTVFWILCVGFALLSVLNTAVRMNRGGRILANRQTESSKQT